MAPRGSANAVPIAEIARTAAGTLALRGPMVPRHAFPPGAERWARRTSRPTPKASSTRFYPCRIDRMTGTVTVTGPPPGIVSVGGYRFVLSELEDLVRRADGGAFVTALPDALAGHRLAGISGSATTCARRSPSSASIRSSPTPFGQRERPEPLTRH